MSPSTLHAPNHVEVVPKHDNCIVQNLMVLVNVSLLLILNVREINQKTLNYQQLVMLCRVQHIMFMENGLR